MASLENLTSKSGDPNLDLALLQTLTRLSDMFGVLPAFSYFQETGSPNAKATNHPIIESKQDGTVLLGLKLVKELLNLSYPAAGIIAVCAHEYAHILCYSNGMYQQLRPSQSVSPFRAEQFADFMAGYFAGVRKKEDESFPAVIFADTTSLYGGGEHGSAKQRADAINAGFVRAYYAGDQPVAATQQAFLYAMDQQA